MNDVYAAVGEPFSFSEDDKTLFLKLVEEITPDKMESFLRDNCKLFGPNERFARDDKLRHGWRMSGPMYGVCAPTPKRRTELLIACVMAINRQFKIHLILLGVAAPLTQHITGVPAPQPPMQTWAQGSTQSFQELQLKHLEQQQRQQALLAFAPPPSAPDTNRSTTEHPATWPSAYPSPDFLTGPLTVPSPKLKADSARTGPLNAGSLTPEPIQSQPPTAEWYAGGAATLDHETHSAKVNACPASTQTGADEIQALPNNLASSDDIALHPTCSATISHEHKTRFITTATTICHPPREAMFPLQTVTASVTETRSESDYHAAISRSLSSDESEGDSTDALLKLDTTLDTTRRIYVKATSNFEEFASARMQELKVVATIFEEHVDLNIAEEKLVQLTNDGLEYARLLDLAEDIVIAHCGSPQQTVRIEEMTPGMKELFKKKPKKNLVKSSPSPSAVVEKSPTAVMLTDFLATTCASSLRSGEMIDVVSVSSLDVSHIDVTFVVHGMTGRKLRQRADCLKRIVRDCLTNVYEWRGAELEEGITNQTFLTLAAQHTVDVISRSLNVNDDIGTAWVGGHQHAVENFLTAVQDFLTILVLTPVERETQSP
ncbi:Hypothetical protein, putative [Bodo saltans]|uniref:Uncharacterized protein n=1 Tax=Bodo saltans TaxID=75058 RepID=A0A0S4IMU3_BODSA|nr:Hypothetical protein, putative [Bodo saltans]|eukprot:CUE59633.1 Hypothetical protein, putative [Bodo saltans]